MGGGGKKAPSSCNLLHIYNNNETWHSYTFSKENPKRYMNHDTHPLISADISIFYRKSVNFAIPRNTDIDCILKIIN